MISIVLAALAISTSPMPLGMSMLPPNINYETFLPPLVQPAKCNPKAIAFDPIFIKEGTALDGQKQLKLSPGFLIDECTFQKQNIEDQSTLLRVSQELNILKNLRLSEVTLIRDAEQKYQERIVQLQADLTKAQEQTWWERNKFDAGVVLGVVVTVGAAVALDRVIHAGTGK